MKALDNQRITTPYVKIPRKLYSNFKIGISPFYKDNIIDMERTIRLVDTISPKIFTVALENAMRKLEYCKIGVMIGCYTICASLLYIVSSMSEDQLKRKRCYSAVRTT
ncbi:hypothetical protein RB195_002576 [Necator americanus]|uniref:Uncharacterized protein n=1 Tax=Necator americanus TaxID=51031 RepID=A0ABR1DJP4_NECAM